jgi:hypothetical protein
LRISNVIVSDFIIYFCTIICTLIVFLLYDITMMVARVIETCWRRKIICDGTIFINVNNQVSLFSHNSNLRIHVGFENKLCITLVTECLLLISPTFTDWKNPQTKTRDYSLIHCITLRPYSVEDQQIVTTDKSLCNLSAFVRLTANLGLPDQTKMIKYKAIMAICLYFCLNYTEYKLHLCDAIYIQGVPGGM